MGENPLAVYADKHDVEYEPSKLAWALLGELAAARATHRLEQRRSAERLSIAVEGINKYVSDPKAHANILEAIGKVGTGDQE